MPSRSAKIKEGFFNGLVSAASLGLCLYLGNTEKIGDLVKSIGTAVGGNWLSDHTGQYLKAIKNKWIANDNKVVNHHVQRALIAAVGHAVDDINQQYIALAANKKEAKARRDATAVFSQLFIDTAGERFMEAVGLEFEREELFMYLSQEPSRIKQALESRLGLKQLTRLASDADVMDSAYAKLFQERAYKLISFYFKEELKKGEQAKHAMDLLYHETIRGHVVLIPGLVEQLDRQLVILQELQRVSVDSAKEPLMEQRFSVLGTMTARMIELVSTVNKQPRLRYDYRKLGGGSKSVFRSQYTEFCGRERELGELRDFFHSPGSFAWLLVTGAAGTGKSRLMMELCFHLASRTAVWAGFLDQHVLDNFDWTGWQPDQPTLIIIDYASVRHKRIIQLIKDLNDPVRAFEHPVRLILIERSISGQWWKDMEYEMVQTRMPAAHLAPIHLTGLEEENCWLVIVDVLRKEGAQIPDKEPTLAGFKKVDPQLRPLLAIFYAFAVASKENTVNWNIDDLLARQLDREEREVWLPLLSVDEEGVLLFKDLLCFGTMCGGLSDLDMEKVKANAPVELQSHFDGRALHRMRLALKTNQDQGVPSLEPDILGEYFVLTHLRTLPSALAGRWINLGWAIAPDRMFAFVQRSLQDFHSKTEQIDFMPASENVNAMVRRTLVWAIPLYMDLLNQPLQAKRTAPSHPIVQVALQMMTDLMSVVGASLHYPETFQKHEVLLESTCQNLLQHVKCVWHIVDEWVEKSKDPQWDDEALKHQISDITAKISTECRAFIKTISE
jgi:hypothetical protein